MSQVPYEVIENASSLPPEVQAKALDVQGTEGITVVQAEDAAYAILSAGEKSQGGFSIDVRQVRQADRKIEIVAQVVEPPAGSFAIQMISYPQTVVKLSKSDLVIQWVTS